jgi:hypothetical protein
MINSKDGKSRKQKETTYTSRREISCSRESKKIEARKKRVSRSEKRLDTRKITQGYQQGTKNRNGKFLRKS